MKINFFTILGLLFLPTSALASANCTTGNCTSNTHAVGKDVDGCTGTTYIGCYRSPNASIDFHLYHCTGCKGNKVRREIHVYDCPNVVEYQCVCANNCKDSAFKSTGTTGYMSGVNCGDECNNATQYICAAGYYGKPTSGSSGCSKCPSPGTSYQGATTISDCYIPKGSYSDTTGKYAFNCDCPYNGRNNCSTGGSSSSSAA